ncbi:hypothetical protein KM043_005325 [Ampulex compressa]|nr:hypothetical protein KM043_005325 [Ampulex compressa]
MYSESDDASDIEEDFFSALALLHSTEDGSAEKLRKMLDASIEKKYGSGKTLAVRMPKKFLQGPKIRDKPSAVEISERRNAIAGEKTEVGARKPSNRENLSLLTNNVAEDTSKPRYSQILEVEFEDCTEIEDIPRISIPDEGSADGALCKICNGAKLGPLILLECQECQDVYHPLCHQPPVVDIDVYDPRLVWRCGVCADTSTMATPMFVSDENKLLNKLHVHDVALTGTEIPPKIDNVRNVSTNSQKNESRNEENISIGTKS